MKNNHQFFLNKVIALAVKNVKKNSGGPFAAIVVKDNKIISYGYNQVTAKKDPTLHAEIDAIRKASKKLKTFDLKNCVIYSSCQPCPMCLSAIYWANIKQLYYLATKQNASNYGFRDALIYKELLSDKKSKILKKEKLEADNYLLPFKLWDKKTDKVKY